MNARDKIPATHQCHVKKIFHTAQNMSVSPCKIVLKKQKKQQKKNILKMCWVLLEGIWIGERLWVVLLGVPALSQRYLSGILLQVAWTSVFFFIYLQHFCVSKIINLAPNYSLRASHCVPQQTYHSFHGHIRECVSYIFLSFSDPIKCASRRDQNLPLLLNCAQKRSWRNSFIMWIMLPVESGVTRIPKLVAGDKFGTFQQHCKNQWDQLFFLHWTFYQFSH